MSVTTPERTNVKTYLDAPVINRVEANRGQMLTDYLDKQHLLKRAQLYDNVGVASGRPVHTSRDMSNACYDVRDWVVVLHVNQCRRFFCS